jgi:GT2 family glycosyltransferase
MALRRRSYANWIKLYDRLSRQDRRRIRAHIEALPFRPLISVIMPAYDTPAALLSAAIASVRAQLYPNWELCIADDASTAPHVPAILTKAARSDPRIRWVRREANGDISAASNSALALATGEFVALLDHDDLLAERALYEVAVEIGAHPDVDLIYSDEDRLDARGRRHSPYFKTDWNPELFLGQNMVSHLGVYRHALVERLGGFREGLEGSQDYDLALRVSRESAPERIRHIPSVLYHWRDASPRGSFSSRELDRCVAAARKSKTEHLHLMGEAAIVEANPLAPNWERIRRSPPSPAPLVSVVVPTRNRHDVLRPCLEGLLCTRYDPIELIVIDHESDEPATVALLRKTQADPRVRVIRYEGAFNFSAMNNRAVAEARGSIIAFVNNDTEVIDPDWLTEMVALAAAPRHGAVGAKLVYPDGRLQHAGVVLGIHGIAAHVGQGAVPEATGYFGRLALATNVSAVTAACLVVGRAVFDEVGGFNATDLPVSFNDIDLCLRLRERGYLNVWTPFARMLHHESASRGSDHDPQHLARALAEARYMRKRWGDQLTHDPFYNVNLSLDSTDFELAFPPRRRPVWCAANVTPAASPG